MNAKQKLDLAYARVEQTSAELITAAKVFAAGGGVSWQSTDLHKAAREYASAIRSLAMRARS